MSLNSGIVLMLLLSFTKSQNIPASYTYTTTDSISVNGSSATGHCSSVTNNSGITTCTVPSSSVLFDGIPTLTGLDGDMWASQLLTLQLTTGMVAEISFDFSNNPNFRVERLEVVMFSCPQRGTAVQTIKILETTEVGIFSPGITSCDSLVRVCTSVLSSIQNLSLQFFSRPGSEWVYLAELRFFGNGATCPIDIIITTPPPPDSTLATMPSGITLESPPPGTTLATTPPPGTSLATPTSPSPQLYTTLATPPGTTLATTPPTTPPPGISLATPTSPPPGTTLATTPPTTPPPGTSLATPTSPSPQLDTTLATPPDTTLAPKDTTQEITSSRPDTTLATTPLDSNTTEALALFTSPDTTQEITTHETTSNSSTMQTTHTSDSSPGSAINSIIIILVVVVLASLLVGIVIAVLILWRCYHAKHHKLVITQQMELEEHSAGNRFSGVEVEAGELEDSPCAQLYPQEDQTPVSPSAIFSLVDDKKELLQPTVIDTQVNQQYESISAIYSLVDDGKKTLSQLSDNENQLYAQVDVADQKVDMPTSSIYSSVDEEENEKDKLYAQVDKKQHSKKAHQLHTPEPDRPVDQLYAQVNKKKKNSEEVVLHTSESDIPAAVVDQLYAQVNKKVREERKEEKEETKVSPEKSEAVYSIVNKPRAPQLPPKSQLLVEELQLL